MTDGPLVARRMLLASAAATLLGVAVHRALRAEAAEDRPDLMTVFHDHGVLGTFVLYDVVRDRTVTVGAGRAAQRYVPASTFKIANSLIALEVGAVKDENQIIPYGGKPQPFKRWEEDMSMRQAIAMSNAAIYQELARRIGLDQYHFWLDRLAYGNKATGNALETFWLDGPLEISAIEQAHFVAKLAQKKLPVSVRSQMIVRDILRIESSGTRTLYAKTGWRFSGAPQLGWWTGWVEDDRTLSTFALNIDIASPEDGKKREAIGRIMLAKLGVL
jgi:beta-lactamase class D